LPPASVAVPPSVGSPASVAGPPSVGPLASIGPASAGRPASITGAASAARPASLSPSSSSPQPPRAALLTVNTKNNTRDILCFIIPHGGAYRAPPRAGRRPGLFAGHRRDCGARNVKPSQGERRSRRSCGHSGKTRAVSGSGPELLDPAPAPGVRAGRATVGALAGYTAARARSRSAMRSSASSTPTDRRTRLFLMPTASRCSVDSS
jgi:hypothetical protein